MTSGQGSEAPAAPDRGGRARRGPGLFFTRFFVERLCRARVCASSPGRARLSGLASPEPRLVRLRDRGNRRTPERARCAAAVFHFFCGTGAALLLKLLPCLINAGERSREEPIGRNSLWGNRQSRAETNAGRGQGGYALKCSGSRYSDFNRWTRLAGNCRRPRAAGRANGARILTGRFARRPSLRPNRMLDQ